MATQFDFLLSPVRAAGVTLSGGKVHFYQPGTTVDKAIWLDHTETTLSANPATLDSNGTALLFGFGLYRVVVKDASGVTRFDRDNISSNFYDEITLTVDGDQEITGKKTFTQDVEAPNIAQAVSSIAAHGVTLAEHTETLADHAETLTTHTSGISANAGAIVALTASVAAVQTGQTSSIVGYGTRTELFNDLAHAAKSVGYVNADANPLYNGYYIKSGASGAGAWAQSNYDRVALVETTVNGSLASTDTTDLFVFQDAVGNRVGSIGQGGALYLGNDDKSIQQRILESDRNAYRASTVLALNKAGNAVEHGRIYAAAKEADNALVEPAYLRQFPVMVEDADNLYRIASVCKVAENHILIAYQKTIPNINTDAQNGVIEVVDAVLDPNSKHVTISAPRVVVSHRDVLSGTNGAITAYAAGATLCKVHYGTNARRVYLFFVSNVHQADPINVAAKSYLTYSDDDGATWAEPVLFAAMESSLAGIEVSSTASGPNGIQLVYGAHAGRLVVPFYVSNAATYSDQFLCVYSDDGGATWTVGGRLAYRSNETCIAEDIDGTIYAFSRRTEQLGEAGNNYRAMSKSTDGGVTWTLVAANAYLDSSCNGSIVQAGVSGSTPKFIHANATAQTIRGDLCARVSYGSPVAADGEVMIPTRETRAAYTAIEMFNAQDILLVVEVKENYLGADGTVQYGVISQSLAACVMNVRTILEG